jgi:cytosine/adenosine deaminase-related metal-dependent hydrolase
MRSVVLSGRILHRDGWSEGSILVRNGKIEEVSDRSSGDLEGDDVVKGLIFPGLMNMHSHLGDHGARGDLPVSLVDTVLPGGVKHRFLSDSPQGALRESIRNSLNEMHHGVTLVLDFREGGLKGLDLLGSAIPDSHPQVCPLGRAVNDEDPVEVLKRSCGIGQPSFDGETSRLRKMASGMGKLFSVHASEMYREELGPILDARPDLLVHMVSGTPEDHTAISENDIPVVVCPRSNQAYGLPTPVFEMMKAGIGLVLGTDNSISMKQDMFREMEAAWILLRRGGMTGKEAAEAVFDMAVGRTVAGTDVWKRLPGFTKWWESGWPRRGDPAHVFTIEEPVSDLWEIDPFSQLVRFTGQSQVRFTGPL